jgi:hypothetical protein
MSVSKEDQAWLFDRGTWSKIVDHIYKSDESNLSNAFRQAGYEEKPVMRLGSIEHGFSVEVYEPAHGQGAPTPRTPYWGSAT